MPRSVKAEHLSSSSRHERPLRSVTNQLLPLVYITACRDPAKPVGLRVIKRMMPPQTINKSLFHGKFKLIEIDQIIH